MRQDNGDIGCTAWKDAVIGVALPHPEVTAPNAPECSPGANRNQPGAQRRTKENQFI
jgi:hypothetical protein